MLFGCTLSLGQRVVSYLLLVVKKTSLMALTAATDASIVAVCWQEEVACERDYLKQELGMFLEQISSLEKENATLALELKEKRETDEFKSLEEEFRNEHEVRERWICCFSLTRRAKGLTL